MRPSFPRSQALLGNAFVPEAPLRLLSAFILHPLSFILLCLLAVGCTGTKTADSSTPAAYVKPENRYKVTAETAPFFHGSPQQPAGADEQLKKDTRLTFVRRFAGYSQVETPGGTTGYVDSADVAPISPKEAADEDAARLAAQAPPLPLLGPTGAVSGTGGRAGGDGGGNGGSYRPPPEAFRETTLPVPDVGPASPKPTPNPMFRD